MSDLLWTVGFLEGEGHFGMFSTKYGIYAHITVTQKDRTPLDYLQEVYGGYIYPCGKWKGWQWRLNGDSAIRMMERVLPHVKSISKRRQIEDVLLRNLVEREGYVRQTL